MADTNEFRFMMVGQVGTITLVDTSNAADARHGNTTVLVDLGNRHIVKVVCDADHDQREALDRMMEEGMLVNLARQTMLYAELLPFRYQPCPYLPTKS